MTDRRPQPPVALLLFCSGLCALVYQTVWLREFRLIFGASTAASAAVLGIFMAGLGLGSAVLGKRAEATRRPLEFYGNLEVLISISAALTPFLLMGIRAAYIAIGGSPVLGGTGATIARLLLSTLVLLVPTFLMGGTLPAAARAAESEDDTGRRRLALLYGCNTLGAVAGATLSTFFLIESLGNRQTLWFACGINVLVAMVARVMGRRMDDVVSASATTGLTESAPGTRSVSPRFVIVAAAGVGWAFMLMELVWYRMLGSILGGSTFTFGLILAIALLGIGLGGALYSLMRSNTQPNANAFAATCALEALLIAVPFALGDRIALLALQLRHLSVFGFEGHLLGWCLVSSIVVLPAAIVAGYQFPMLIALLGRGREGVGKHTGLAYAANTVGAIVGSLAGGFGLLPALGAIGSWKLVVVGLVVLALVAIVEGARTKEAWRWRSLIGAGTAVCLLFATGPTATWRHSGIGAGRLNVDWKNTNTARAVVNAYNRHIGWEQDGVESSVAISTANAYSFIVNGKSDGNSRADMGTQIMAGLVGTILHPEPKRSMVIGLGTGSTAGWMAAVPSMQVVDVAELEPAILHVAELCGPVNENVLKNPKVRMHIGDAREALLTTRENYDLIFSEPSNPYRAGIASLFSLEFYQAAAARLAKGGYFLQWVQTYDIDAEALQTVYATLGSVFPHVDTWYTLGGDLLLIASREPVSIDIGQLRARLASEPYVRAARFAWSVDSAEGFLEHFVAGAGFARLCKDSNAPVSTDDRNYLEFGFARGVGRGRVGEWTGEMREIAQKQGWHRPMITNGTVDWTRVEAHRPGFRARDRLRPLQMPGETAELVSRRNVAIAYVAGETRAAHDLWKAVPFEPLNPYEREMLATCLGIEGHPDAGKYLQAVRAARPLDADAIEAQIHIKAKRWPEAVALLEKVFAFWRTDPWTDEQIVTRTLEAVKTIVRGANDPALMQRIYLAARQPFMIHMRDGHRQEIALIAAEQSGAQAPPHLAEVFDQMGKFPSWTRYALSARVKGYRALNHPQLEQALRDLERFVAAETPRFQEGLRLPKDDTAQVSGAQQDPVLPELGEPAIDDKSAGPTEENSTGEKDQ